MKKNFLWLLMLLMPFLAAAQQSPYQHNFFDTNLNPIVEVVAGTNGIQVLYSTIGVDKRRYTVSYTNSASTAAASNLWYPVNADNVWIHTNSPVEITFSVTNVPTADVARFVNGTLTNNTSGAASWATNASNATNFWGQLYATNLPASYIAPYAAIAGVATNQTGTNMTFYGNTVIGPGGNLVGNAFGATNLNLIAFGDSGPSTVVQSPLISLVPYDRVLQYTPNSNLISVSSQLIHFNGSNIDGTLDASKLTPNSTLPVLNGSNLTNVDGATSAYQFVTLNQLQQSLAVFRAFYLWSGSNSVVNTNAKAMRTLDYGAAPLGTNTVTVYSNDQYIVYCSPAAGLTELKAGTYQVTADIWQSAIGADAVSLAAEIYVFHPGTYTETEITPVAGTSSQVITGSKLQYIFTLTVSTNVPIAATDSIELKFKTSGTAGTPVTLYIESGALQVPTPASQYPLLAANNTFSGSNYFSGGLGAPTFSGNVSGAAGWATNAKFSTNFVGQLNVSNFNAGASASGSTYLRGDGTWAAVTATGGGSSNITDSGTAIIVSGAQTNQSVLVLTNTAGASPSGATRLTLAPGNQGTTIFDYTTNGTSKVSMTSGGNIDAAGNITATGTLVGTGKIQASQDATLEWANRSRIFAPDRGGLRICETPVSGISIKDRYYILGAPTILTDESATSIFKVTARTNDFVGGTIHFTIFVTDNTDYQTYSGIATYANQNTNGVWITTAPTENTSSQTKSLSGGTLTAAWSAVAATTGGTTNIMYQLTTTSSLTPAANKCYVLWQIQQNSTNTISVSSF